MKKNTTNPTNTTSAERINIATQDTVDSGIKSEAADMFKDTDTAVQAISGVPDSWLGLVAKEDELQSYSGTKRIVQGRLDDAYQERDKTMRRLHINPVADITNGVYTQDDLNKIDQQVKKYNANPRTTKKLETNDDILQNLRSKVDLLNRQVEFAKQNRGFVSKIASDVLSNITSARYDPLHALKSGAEMLSYGAAEGVLGALTGGAYFIPEVGAAALDYSENVYNAKEDNDVRKILGQKTSNIYRTAAFSTAFDVGMQKIAFDKYIGKAYSGAKTLGAGAVEKTLGSDILKQADKKVASKAAEAVGDIVEDQPLGDTLNNTFKEDPPVPKRTKAEDLQEIIKNNKSADKAPSEEKEDLSSLSKEEKIKHDIRQNTLDANETPSNVDDFIKSKEDVLPKKRGRPIKIKPGSEVHKEVFNVFKKDSSVLRFTEKYKAELTPEFKSYLTNKDPEIRALALNRLKESDISDVIYEEMSKRCRLGL